ncbi:hypothetical protein G9A89_010836 [Geosiphon pyriformis]|nr:hypothetical protein G9A89_010836 [Geosiphon pyriformis]
MCDRFIRFFGNIHNSQVNKVMTDFGLTDEYYTGLTSFFAAGVFINDTIWVGSNQAATQHILNVASEFFRFNDIFINNDKTVVILINCQVSNLHLTVTRVKVNPSDNFLAGMIHIFSGCDLFLGSFLASVFHYWGGTPMSLVFGEPNYFKYVSFLRQYKKQLDSHGPVSVWFELSVHFLGGETSPSVCSLPLDVSSDVLWSHDFGVIGVNLLHVNAARLFVYTDKSLSSLRTPSMMADTAVFFENINLGLGVGVSGLVSSTMIELQTIALALECILFFCSVDLFSDSQAALDTCKSESVLAYLNFRNWCWVKYHHIVNVICRKNLDVNWIKVKSHSDVSGNKHANALTRAAVFSNRCLPYIVNKQFLQADDMTISGNSCLHADIDWSRSLLVWHPDFYLAAGFTSTCTAGFCSYFIKTLHHHLPVVCYPSVVYLFCGNVEVSDHVFSCSFDAAGHAHLIEAYASYHESVSVFKNSKVAAQNITFFVHKFCLAFQNDIWLVHNKHQTIMEKGGLILPDGSVSVLVSGLLVVLSAGVVRLLGITNAFGVSFGFYKSCLFFLGIGNLISVYIGV